MSSGEDAFSKLLGTLLAWLLMIYAVCWIVKWLLRKIVENAAPLIGLGGLILFVSLMGWIAWNLWKKYRLSQAKRKSFEACYGAMLSQFEKDVALVETNFTQVERTADSTAQDMKTLERKLQTLS